MSWRKTDNDTLVKAKSLAIKIFITGSWYTREGTLFCEKNGIKTLLWYKENWNPCIWQIFKKFTENWSWKSIYGQYETPGT